MSDEGRFHYPEYERYSKVSKICRDVNVGRYDLSHHMSAQIIFRH